MEMGVAPCGGVQKKASNTLTTKGSSINFIWEIMVPENTGNCTVKISAGLQNEENFELLKPVDGEINEDGSFACGREKGFETKEFILPEDYVCDGCTLQWKWTSSYGHRRVSRRNPSETQRGWGRQVGRMALDAFGVQCHQRVVILRLRRQCQLRHQVQQQLGSPRPRF